MQNFLSKQAAKSSQKLRAQLFCIMRIQKTLIASQGKEIMIALSVNKVIYLDFCWYRHMPRHDFLPRGEILRIAFTGTGSLLSSSVLTLNMSRGQMHAQLALSFLLGELTRSWSTDQVATQKAKYSLFRWIVSEKKKN